MGHKMKTRTIANTVLVITLLIIMVIVLVIALHKQLGGSSDTPVNKTEETIDQPFTPELEAEILTSIIGKIKK